MKNRFNSTIRKRKLAESDGRSGFTGPPADASDDELDNRNEEDVYHDQRNFEAALPMRQAAHKKMRTESHSFRPSPSRNYPTIPQGYSIISLSKDDLKALHIAERLLRKLVQMDSPISPLYINQLMSLLTLTHVSDFASIFASLNMIPITNIAEHESPITPSSTKSGITATEFESQDYESHESLRVDSNRGFGMFDPQSVQHLKNKKFGYVFKKSSGENHLWAPAEDQVESKRLKLSSKINSNSDSSRNTLSSSSLSSSSSYRQDQPSESSFSPMLEGPRSPYDSCDMNGICNNNSSGSGSGNGSSESRISPSLDASLPADFEEVNISNEVWINQNQNSHVKNELIGQDRDNYVCIDMKDKGNIVSLYLNLFLIEIFHNPHPIVHEVEDYNTSKLSYINYPPPPPFQSLFRSARTTRR